MVLHNISFKFMSAYECPIETRYTSKLLPSVGILRANVQCAPDTFGYRWQHAHSESVYRLTVSYHLILLRTACAIVYLLCHMFL